MADSLQTQIEALRASIAGLEAQRALLGDAVAGPALAALRQQLDALEAQAAPPTSPGERRVVTILFADVVGSTALGERLDPEELAEVMNGAFAFANATIARHGGKVIRLMGDAVLALFGATDVYEDDAERAVRAGLEIQAAAQEYADHIAENYAAAFQMRVGIHTGLVLLAVMGDEIRAEFTAMGDATNVAARLQSAAPPGGVLVSDDTYRYIRGIFDVTRQAPLSVKGKSEPLDTYLVTGTRARLLRTVTRGVEGVSTRIIGREAEWAGIQAAWREACEGRRVFWVQLVGEAGVGKSRLLAGMDEWLSRQGMPLWVLRSRAFERDAVQPFALVRRLWFDRFQIAEDAPRAQAEARWVQGVTELLGAADPEPAHALGLLLGLPFHNSPYIGALRSDPAQVRGRALVVSRELIRRVRAHVPLVVLLEDLHWADGPSWEYLRDVLLDAGPGAEALHGAFVLATARPEGAIRLKLLDAESMCRCARIELQPLSGEACHALVRALLRHCEVVPEEAVELIATRSEGVPYYAEELINLLIDQGVIDRSAVPWRFVQERLQRLPLPGTLHHLLLARLLSLTLVQRVGLQRGAVFGRRFWEEGIAALGISSPHEVLEPLGGQGFVDRISESAFEGNYREWSFHHDLLRQVTYESILKRDRPALHRAAAAWLQEQAEAGGRQDEFAGLLAEHTERGGDGVGAGGWYLRAGEHAKARGASLEARQFYERALELLPADDAEQRWTALLGLSEVLGILGEPEARRAADQALIATARQSGDDARLAEAYYRQASWHSSIGEETVALQISGAALAAAVRAGDARIEAQILGLRVITQTRLGAMEEAQADATRAMALAEALGDEETLSHVLINVAVYYAESGDLSRAAQVTRQRTDINLRRRERLGSAVGLTNLGYYYVMLGLYEMAAGALAESLALGISIGARRFVGFNRLNLGLAHVRNGEFPAAQREIERALADLEASGDRFGRAVGRTYLGLALEQAGDVTGAREKFAEARDALAGIGFDGYTADALAGLARCALASADAEAARQWTGELWDHLDRRGPRGMEFPVWAYLTCAYVFDLLGDAPKTRIAVETGYRELMQRADLISDTAWRGSFLESVPEHRAMRKMWQLVNDNADTTVRPTHG